MDSSAHSSDEEGKAKVESDLLKVRVSVETRPPASQSRTLCTKELKELKVGS